MQAFLYLIPALPLLGAIVCGILHTRSRETRRYAGPVATLAVLSSFVIACLAFLEVEREGKDLVYDGFTWISSGELELSFKLLLDPLSAFMALIVCGVGFLIHLYSIGYMRADEGKAKFFAYLNLFIFAMSILILGASMPLLLVGWEGVGAMSYLLIGFWYDKDEGWPAKAGQKAFITNRIGDLGFLLGMFFLFQHFGTLDFTAMREGTQLDSFTGSLAFWTCTLLFFGACGKSAQIPLFVWLPDAMAGPTPVSALIHAATMVTAGVYMICRASFLFPPEALMLVAWVGAITALVAGAIAIAQRDLKKILAYSTVSQLGYMFLACGVGAFSAAIFHVATHAFFKALLFLGAGSVIHGMRNEQDCFKMGGLAKKMPVTCLTFLVGALCLAGFPFTSGFFSKDEILWETVKSGSMASWTLWGIAAMTAGLTAFYSFRLFTLTFFGSARYDSRHVHPHESPKLMTLPLVVLAVLAAGGGILGLSPVLTGEAGWMHRNLEGVVASAQPFLSAEAVELDHHLEFRFLIISSLIAVFGVACGFLLYRKGPALAGRLARPLTPLHICLAGKFFIDELYEVLILTPLAMLSRLAGHFDVKVVDGVVNRTAGGMRELATVLKQIQNGRLQSYALWLAGGSAAILAFVVFQLW